VALRATILAFAEGDEEAKNYIDRLLIRATIRDLTKMAVWTAMAAASAVAPLEEDKMRETILALIAVTLVSACSVTSAFAAGGMGGFAVGGYPASFGGNYAEGAAIAAWLGIA
jgi:hypothetical protein